jgi:hypothetical protein
MEPPSTIPVVPEGVDLLPVVDANHGLINFMRYPPGLKGIALLNHMTMFIKRRLPKGEYMRPSPGLDIAMTKEQQMILDPTPADLTMREILKDSGGTGAMKKMVKRKLDSVGYVTAFCEFANDPKKLKRMDEAMNLAASISEITRLEAADVQAKKADEDAELKTVGPVALGKLYQKNLDFNQITVKELRAIAHNYYGQSVGTGLKAVVVKAVQGLYAKRPDLLPPNPVVP